LIYLLDSTKIIKHPKIFIFGLVTKTWQANSADQYPWQTFQYIFKVDHSLNCQDNSNNIGAQDLHCLRLSLLKRLLILLRFAWQIKIHLFRLTK
jgi:hypothetical protein